MKKMFAPILTLLLLLPVQQAVAAVDTYKIDPNHSYVLWHINHLGFSTQTGKWMAQGVLTIDEAQPQNSKVDVTIQVAELITGLPELDKHLKEKLFFDVDQFPTATFVSDKVEPIGKDRAKVYGKLTVRGVTHPIDFEVKLNKQGENPVTNKMTVGFSGETQLKRSDYGLTAYLPGLSDEVKLNLELEASK